MARKTATPRADDRVKLTVPVDRMLHARLSAFASLSGRDKGALAEEFIRQGLSGKIRITRQSVRGEGDIDGSVEPSGNEESAA